MNKVENHWSRFPRESDEGPSPRVCVLRPPTGAQKKRDPPGVLLLTHVVVSRVLGPPVLSPRA